VPILEDDSMDERAVLWPNLGDAGDGQPVQDEPREIWCECRLKSRLAYGPDGTKLTIDGTLSALVDIPKGSLVWVAPDHTVDAVEQWYSSGSAGQADERMLVVSRSKTRDAKSIEVRYTYGLVWYRDNTG
jgi:hypothetical protein